MDDFYDYLEQYARSHDDERRGEINRKLWDEFGIEEAVLVSDMAGFTRLSRMHGLTHYLSMVQRMRMTARPTIEHNNGHIVKFEADNCFARFPDVLDAVNAAISYSHTLEAMNLTTPDDFDIHASFGIDFGKFLLVRQTDFWGIPVNMASLLGEDLADSGEILITDAALKRIPPGAQIKSQPVDFSKSGFDIKAHRILT